MHIGPHRSYIGLKQHFAGESLDDHLDLHVFEGGYCGMSQVEAGRTNVCLMVEEPVFRRITAGNPNPVAHFIDAIGVQNAHLRSWLASATPLYPDWLSIAQVSLVDKTPVEGDILCAGDASGMIAPLAGDGMAMALHGGIIAADAVHRYLSQQQDATTTRSRYIEAWQQTFRPRLRLGRMLQSAMMRPALLTPGLHMMQTFPAVGNWMISNTRNLKLLEQTP